MNINHILKGRKQEELHGEERKIVLRMTLTDDEIEEAYKRRVTAKRPKATA